MYVYSVQAIGKKDFFLYFNTVFNLQLEIGKDIITRGSTFTMFVKNVKLLPSNSLSLNKSANISKFF